MEIEISPIKVSPRKVGADKGNVSKTEAVESRSLGCDREYSRKASDMEGSTSVKKNGEEKKLMRRLNNLFAK